MRALVTGATQIKQIKRSVLLAWILCLLCIIGASVNVVIWLLNQSGPPSFFDLREIFGWGWALPVVFSALAALIISRQPSNRVGWLLMLPALVAGLPLGANLATPQTALTPGLWLLLWFDFWSWIPVIFPVFLIPLHFPTGRPPSRRWNWVNWLALGMWVYFMLIVVFLETIGPINYDWRLPNPIGFISDQATDTLVGIVWAAGLITMVLASVISLFLRYRRALTVERQQIKWLLYAGAVFVVVYSQQVFFSDTDIDGYDLGGWVGLLLLLSILSFPVAITIAILRNRLFEIDVIIRKTLVYGVVTVLLAMIYFGSVVILQALFAAVSGERSAVAIVLSTLAIAALFSPLRRRVQRWIDRRFYRRKYDAAGILAAFAETARDEVDLESLNRAILDVIEATVQPEQASLWLRPVAGKLEASDRRPLVEGKAIGSPAGDLEKEGL